MSTELGKRIVEDFLTNSISHIKPFVEALYKFKGNERQILHLFSIKHNQKNQLTLDKGHFFLRTSVEYSNPQLTVEEVQGIIAALLIAVSGNYLYNYGLHEINKKDTDEICEELSQPTIGKIVPFLLNTDDVEPDRYSMNPLKESIVVSGQSALPAASVKTEQLRIDPRFLEKYEGKLISKEETELINYHLESGNSDYMDMVDKVKYEQLEDLSKSFGMNLSLPLMRVPITLLKNEGKKGLLHFIIQESHRNFNSIEKVYSCMGRSMKKRTTLLTIPHSKIGFGSKRAARGRIYFDDERLERVKVVYKPTKLYPNAIDPNDISIAQAQDSFIVSGNKLVNYDYYETPSSPQFILYALSSPENGAIWHGIGAFGASQLVKSYTTTYVACSRNSMIQNLTEKFGVNLQIPIQFNLKPKKLWVHPIYDNIDASIGCVEDLQNLAKMGVHIELLSNKKYIRK